MYIDLRTFEDLGKRLLNFASTGVNRMHFSLPRGHLAIPGVAVLCAGLEGGKVGC